MPASHRCPAPRLLQHCCCITAACTCLLVRQPPPLTRRCPLLLSLDSPLSPPRAAPRRPSTRPAWRCWPSTQRHPTRRPRCARCATLCSSGGERGRQRGGCSQSPPCTSMDPSAAHLANPCPPTSSPAGAPWRSRRRRWRRRPAAAAPRCCRTCPSSFSATWYTCWPATRTTPPQRCVWGSWGGRAVCVLLCSVRSCAAAAAFGGTQPTHFPPSTTPQTKQLLEEYSQASPEEQEEMFGGASPFAPFQVHARPIARPLVSPLSLPLPPSAAHCCLPAKHAPSSPRLSSSSPPSLYRCRPCCSLRWKRCWCRPSRRPRPPTWPACCRPPSSCCGRSSFARTPRRRSRARRWVGWREGGRGPRPCGCHAGDSCVRLAAHLLPLALSHCCSTAGGAPAVRHRPRAFSRHRRPPAGRQARRRAAALPRHGHAAQDLLPLCAAAAAE